jgi:hypothetical protein
MKKIIIGIIIMALGIFLLFDNLGFFIPIVRSLVISWQSLLIALGCIFLFDKKSDHKNVGVILILIGTLFLLPKILDVSIGGVVIPLLLIAIGIFFVIRAATRRDGEQFLHFHEHFHKHREHFHKYNEKTFVETSVNQDGIIHREYVMTGVKERWSYGKVKNVEIEAVFSGVELDFTQAELSDEVDTIRIKVSSVFSGVILYVPQEWNIIIQKTGVFGGFTDRRPYNKVQLNNKIVVMELEAVFGGGEIKSYE